MLILIQRISHSVSKVYSQRKKLKLFRVKDSRESPDKKGNWNRTQVSVFKISAQLIIDRFKNLKMLKNFQAGFFSPS